MTYTVEEYLNGQVVISEQTLVDLSFRKQDISGQAIGWYLDKYRYSDYVFPTDVAEMALAHTIQSKVEAAVNGHLF